MKKFIALTTALVAAMVAQAASVEWTSGSLRTAKQAQSDITGITAYYYVINQATYNELANKSPEQIYYTYFNEDGSAKEGAATPNATVTANAFGVANWEQDNVNVASLENNTEYVVAIYQAKSEFGGTYALASVAYATFDPEADPEFAEAVGGSFDGIGTAAYASASGHWTAVPEPTTVALLALGLAAVGMKRKVA